MVTGGDRQLRSRAGAAGAVACLLSLGLTELAVGLFGVPSVVGAVADRIVGFTPGAVDRFVITVLATLDKPVLIILIVAVAAYIGTRTGRAALRRPWVAPAVFALFAGLGSAAAAPEPGASLPGTATTTALSAALGVVVLQLLLRAARVESAAPAAAGDHAATRRQFLVLAGGALAVAGAAVAGGRLLAGSAVNVARSLTRLPTPARPAPSPPPGASLDVPGITPLVSSNDDFYRIDTAVFVPQLQTSTWQLRVTGMVDRPLTLTYDQLLAMPMIEEYVTLTCVSNPVGGNLAGNARWLGVPLTALLDRAGVRAGADQLVGRAVDGFTVGMPVAAVRDGRIAMIAVGMNGEPLPFEHGFPARIVVAGLYGYVSATKWLAELELTTFQAYDAYWVQRGWSQRGPIKTESRIDVPGDGAQIAAGQVTVAGVAWAQTRGIQRVEVQIDGGAWADAQLADAIGPDTWRQWRFAWQAAPGAHRIAVRATDGHGEVQTAQQADPAPDGATGYHTIQVQAG